MSIRIDHIGIATDNIEQATKFWTVLGLIQGRDETNDEQGVNIRFFGTDSGDSPKIKLLEPLGRDTPIGKFLDKRGPGIQQLAFEVDDLKATIAHLIGADICMIHETPMDGAHGTKIAFVHPSSTGGVLVELVQYVTQ